VAAALAAAEDVITRELDDLTSRRPGTIDGVDAGLLARYDKMREHFGGIAVARLDKNRCDGCHLEISATELDHMKREPAEALVEFEHCGRLLLR
jgi:predicted  nucleic acid-binding Zn-ribbon protein